MGKSDDEKELDSTGQITDKLGGEELGCCVFCRDEFTEDNVKAGLADDSILKMDECCGNYLHTECLEDNWQQAKNAIDCPCCREVVSYDLLAKQLKEPPKWLTQAHQNSVLQRTFKSLNQAFRDYNEAPAGGSADAGEGGKPSPGKK